MPGYKEHTSFAFFCAVALLSATHWHQPLATVITPTNLWLVVAAVLGGLFPDIDIKSKGQLLWYRVIALLSLSGLYYKQVALLLLCLSMAVIPPLLPHRGLTHSVPFIIIFPLIGPFTLHNYQPDLTLWGFYSYLFFVVGALSHVALDHRKKLFRHVWWQRK